MNEFERTLGVSDAADRVPVAPPPASIVDRYRDAYRVAAWQIGIGSVVKGIGVAVGLLMALIGLSSAEGFMGAGAALGGLVMGGIMGGLIWIAGVFIVCQGQVLRATLDTAVHSSTLMTNDQRATAMGLS